MAALYPPTVEGFVAFCEDVDRPLTPFQRRLAAAALGDRREVVCVLPRGSAKTTTAGLLAVHHLLSVPNASVSVGATGLWRRPFLSLPCGRVFCVGCSS